MSLPRMSSARSWQGAQSAVQRTEARMEDPFFTSQAWLELRYQVLKASRGCCQICGARGSEVNPIQVDHIKPRSKFPELALVSGNLQVACRKCNLGKSNKDQTDWRTGTTPMVTLEHADPATKAKYQQLVWLKMKGETPEVRRQAEKELAVLWSKVTTDHFKRLRGDPTSQGEG